MSTKLLDSTADIQGTNGAVGPEVLTEPEKTQAFAQGVEALSQKYGRSMAAKAIIGADGRVEKLFIEIVAI